MRRQIYLGAILIFVVLGTEIAGAQVTTATIMGTVSDSTGAVIPGATVTIRNADTGISRTVTSDAAGRYTAPQLGLGTYEITAETVGFQTVIRRGITLTVGREAVVDFTLQIGAVTERITVVGEAPLVNASNATVGTLVDERTMRDLPLSGRSYADLTSLQPGVVSNLPITAGDTSVFSGGGGITRRVISGSRPQLSMYLLDGIEISTPSVGMPVNSVLGEQLGVDAIREFTVLQFNFGAQYGRAVGGVINAVTQSGTNTLHGGVFEFLRNEALDARDFFLNPALPKAPLKRNQFGASAGGPIQKDRTFFFVNYEGVRQAAGVSEIASVLTPETRLGNITGCPPDPVTKLARPSCSRKDSIVTATRSVNPDIKPVMDLVPLPNGNYRNAGVADYSHISPWRANENYGIVRIDQQLSDKDSLFGRLTIDRSERTDDLAVRYPAGYTRSQTGGYLLAAVSWTRVINPTLLNTARVGYTRRNDHMQDNYTKGGDQYPAAPGLDPRLFLIKGVPTARWAIPGVSLWGNLGTTYGSVFFTDNTFDYDDSLLINRGRHSITLGGNFKRYRLAELFDPWVVGWLSWQTLEDFLDNRPLALTQYIGTSIPGTLLPDNYRGWRQTYGSWYVQDDFQVLSNLTLNLGLRWEWINGPKEVNGKLGAFKDLYRDKQVTLLGKDQAMFDVRDAFKGFSPRVGFAWMPFADRKTVFRGGFGIFKQMPLEYEYQVAIDAPPYTQRMQLERPILKFPYPFQNAAGKEDPSIVTTGAEPLVVPTDVKMPYTMQWTFSVERQLTETLVIKANYVGVRSVDLFGIYNPIQAPTEIVNGRHYNRPGLTPVNPNFTSIRLHNPFSNQSYHAGQLVAEQRFRGGLQFNASYTWSKNIDVATSAGTRCAENIGGTDITIYNSHDFAADKGLSGLHVKHNFIASYGYELPFGAHRRWGNQWTGVLERLLGGWGIHGTNSIRSGLPVAINEAPRQSRCVGQQCPERPDLIPGGNNNPVLENWTPERYFDPSQFVLQLPGFYGNLGRNTLIRPGIFNWNLSFTKDNRITEGTNLEFRAEFFNILNHPNFGTPAGSIFRNAAAQLQPNVGRITDTSTPMRQIQFGLKLTF